MNKIKTTRSILSTVIVAAALGLVACGGGGDSGSPSSLLKDGAIATNGDGVNLTEYNSISCGMPKDEVRRIIADAPTSEGAPVVITYIMGDVVVQFTFGNNGDNLINGKMIKLGKDSIDSVKC